MKKFITIIIVFFYTCFNGFSQQLTLETNLDAALNETSGLLYLNNTLITHNDSGNSNQLFDIDINTGSILRTVTITNAINTDWEDLANDDTYIYIGDFGNNNGNRTDLKIYRIAIADYFSSTSVTAEIINFSYSNQTTFKSKPFNTSFDAEGLIQYNNKLYIFSKNWVEDKIHIYELSKIPGTYSISIIDTIESEGLISGASHNTLDNSIVLCGYDGIGAFIIQLKEYNSGLFSNGSVVKTSINIPENYSAQVEAIIPINTSEYYISAEKSFSDAPGLFRFNTSSLTIKD